ncbi:MAG: FAD-dependent oxidoreductase [Vicinamibacterales bacterium]
MRIGIVGGGISGLLAAYLLSRRHDVTVFEAGDHVGGHTNTVRVDLEDGSWDVDTGFIVFNDRTYPNFVRLLDRLGVPSQTTTMSFSVSCDRTGIEYNGTSINGLFAQRSNLLSPGFHRMVRDILRFNERGPAEAHRHTGATVGQFLDAHEYGAEFRDHYLVPMGASVWSCPPDAFLQFPMRFVMDFFGNHGMLRVWGRPIWRVISGGSRRYVDALTASFAHRILVSTPVRGIRRWPTHADVRTDAGIHAFDEVVLGCHSDQALGLVEDPTPNETYVLRAFPYQANDVVLHEDASVLPRTRGAWAVWNYRIPRDRQAAAMVTYHMNALQGLDAPHQFCVSLNTTASIDPSKVLRRFTYHHPMYTTARDEAQRRHASLVRANRTSYCGAYWGYGFHEDGVNSALAVCRAFGEEL